MPKFFLSKSPWPPGTSRGKRFFWWAPLVPSVAPGRLVGSPAGGENFKGGPRFCGVVSQGTAPLPRTIPPPPDIPSVRPAEIRCRSGPVFLFFLALAPGSSGGPEQGPELKCFFFAFLPPEIQAQKIFRPRGGVFFFFFSQLAPWKLEKCAPGRDPSAPAGGFSWGPPGLATLSGPTCKIFLPPEKTAPFFFFNSQHLKDPLPRVFYFAKTPAGHPVVDSLRAPLSSGALPRVPRFPAVPPLSAPPQKPTQGDFPPQKQWPPAKKK